MGYIVVTIEGLGTEGIVKGWQAALNWGRKYHCSFRSPSFLDLQRLPRWETTNCPGFRHARPE